MKDAFQQWWSKNKNKSNKARFDIFESLSYAEKNIIRQSFLKSWVDLFCRNHIDSLIDRIEKVYEINLIDLRIKALKGKVFLIDRKIWEHIEFLVWDYEPLFNSDILFGGLAVKPWGKKNQFLIIKKKGV